MTTRRDFLRGALSLTVVAVALPSMDALASDGVPLIVGDGAHDDAPGLNAMFSGKPFMVEGEGFVAQGGELRDGVFGIRSTIVVDQNHTISMDRCRIITLPGFEGDYVLHVKTADTHALNQITNCVFDNREWLKAGIAFSS